MHVLLHLIRNFFNDIKFSAKNLPFDPYIVPDCTHQKYLKLGQCLEIDDLTSFSKFGEVT